MNKNQAYSTSKSQARNRSLEQCAPNFVDDSSELNSQTDSKFEESSALSTSTGSDASKLIFPISTVEIANFRQFEKKAGLKFRNMDILNLAFSHRSLISEHGQGIADNERLEFLGDSVLGLIITEYLFIKLPQESEGHLAQIKSVVVSEDTLATIARRLNFEKYILIGRSEELSGGREKKAILADALEAVIGASYLDLGLQQTRDFVLKFFSSEIEKILEGKYYQDFKTLLQEYLQKNYGIYPQYNLVKNTGPDHAKTFWIQVEFLDQIYGPVKGKSKKEAEKKAAKLAFTSLGNL